MRRTLLLFAALMAMDLCPRGVYSQTPRDTAHVRATDSLIAVRMRAEAQRTNVRKTVIRALADTLQRNGRALLVGAVTPPPPVDTVVVPPPPPPLPPIGTTAELPRTAVATVYPTVTGVTRTVLAGGDLQGALNLSRPGDQIVLTPGARYSGNFTLPNTACAGGYIVVRSGTNDADYPAAGVRITPTFAPKLAAIVSPNVAEVFKATNGACKYWFSRVEITSAAQSNVVNYNYGLLRIGDGELTVALQPSDIVFDRVWIHGTATTAVQNGLVMNGRALALIDSWVSEVRWAGVESHCVVGWAGAGPFKIVNNHLSCASINVLFGGAEPAIAGVYPADIEITRNHITKDVAWRGQGYAAKNLLELKNARRVLAQGNIMEHSWPDGQEAMAVNAQSLSDAMAPAQTADLTFAYNVIRDVGQCFVLLAHGYNGSGVAMARVSVTDNLCMDIGVDTKNRPILLGGELQGIAFRHNTFVRRPIPRAETFSYLERGSQAQASRVDFLDNLMGGGMDYPCIWGEARGGDMALAYYAAAWSFAGNVCWDSYGGASAFPAGNYFPLSLTAVGFAADWSLAATSVYRGKATDGRDPGADIGELLRRTAGVVVAP